MLNIPNDINKGITMIPKVIDTDKKYREALAEVERLIAISPKPGTTDADRLALLATLVEVYETKHYHFEMPTPIESIRFRMEEQGLMQRDLVPFIGSKSKVSEVLSGKRPLTIQMIRALHAGLGIPAEVLLQEPQKTKGAKCTDVEIDWQKFPIVEMVKRGWIVTRSQNLQDRSEELIQKFFSPLCGAIPAAAICRRTIHERSSTEMDKYSLIAWTTRILIRSNAVSCSGEYKPGTVTKDFLKEVSRLSWFKQGPHLAQEFLAKNGIAIIIEPHLPQTRLDGGAMQTKDGRPVIGLTLRYDRIDNFWYTLLHELVHIAKHLKTVDDAFVDDLDTEQQDDPQEREADKITRETFIPRSVWIRSDAYLKRTEQAIKNLAEELRIHPAIVAGRIRQETRNYALFHELIGQGEIRKFFPGHKWN